MDALDVFALVAEGGLILAAANLGGAWWGLIAFCAPVVGFYLLREAALTLRGER